MPAGMNDFAQIFATALELITAADDPKRYELSCIRSS